MFNILSVTKNIILDGKLRNWDLWHYLFPFHPRNARIAVLQTHALDSLGLTFE